jgi:hypothetical protein
MPAAPRRPWVRNSSVAPARLMSTRLRPPGSASTRTALRFQALTAISPAKALTVSRCPRSTGMVESICWVRATATSAAENRVDSTGIVLSARGGHQRGGLPEQLELAPHGLGEV